MVRRFSSRQGSPYRDYLNAQLEGARNYDRIAGYFTVSVLEIAGDAISKLQGKARIVCNSQLDAREFNATGGSAMNREWGGHWLEAKPAERNRFKQLLELLGSGKLEIRVAPDDRFGLVHGKAGLIEKADGSRARKNHTPSALPRFRDRDRPAAGRKNSAANPGDHLRLSRVF